MPILVSQLGVLQVIEHPKLTLSIFGKDHTIYGQRERQDTVLHSAMSLQPPFGYAERRYI